MIDNKKVIQHIKERVYEANISLKSEGLVKLTWGNVSEYNSELGIVVIKPSGVEYKKMKKEDMVVTDLQGNVLGSNSLRPSSDLPTHLELYRQFNNISSIVHTHSTFAVKWAQAARDIPVYGTTHADTFYGSIPCTRPLIKKEVDAAYELETARVIVETFQNREIDPLACPGVIVHGHGPFTWGDSPKDAVQASIILDEVANMAMGTEILNEKVSSIKNYLLDKHYYRKHGENAYYGQKK